MARFKTITAKYEGTCRRCGGTIHPGERVRWAKGCGTYHLKENCPACQEQEEPPPFDEESAQADAWEEAQARREREQMNAEYAAGVADARRYQADKAMVGEALADQWAMEDEFNRYWKYGEDY